jgi:hypothetical protein
VAGAGPAIGQASARDLELGRVRVHRRQDGVEVGVLGLLDCAIGEVDRVLGVAGGRLGVVLGDLGVVLSLACVDPSPGPLQVLVPGPLEVADPLVRLLLALLGPLPHPVCGLLGPASRVLDVLLEPVSSLRIGRGDAGLCLTRRTESRARSWDSAISPTSC